MNRGRKITGGKYHKQRKRKLYEKKGQERSVIIREIKRKRIRTRGGNYKTILLSTNEANLTAHGKIQKVTIKKVIGTPQNVFLTRQNRLMKGAIIETSLGKARITNRPSREGMVNAVLLQD